jgi:lipopolysaccharide/colanic/teichoic acid biosynthesis glycosyltransferase
VTAIDPRPARAIGAGLDVPRLRRTRAARRATVARVVKDCWEWPVALVLLIVLIPLLVAVVVAIRLDSRGPAVFRQVRVGRDHRRFVMYKFRTMSVTAEAHRHSLASRNEADGPLFKIREDPRVTRVGRVLRRYSVDEVPQLVNVLLGQMSLVGPRPPLPEEAAAYDPRVRRRLSVKPGLTGLWQVSGRSDLSWEEGVRLDLSYVDNWTLFQDFQILRRTAAAVIRHLGAY